MPYIERFTRGKRVKQIKNRIFTVEKRISVFIGRTIFFTSKNLSCQHFDWLYGFSHYSEEIVSSFCSQHGRRVGEGAKGI